MFRFKESLPEIWNPEKVLSYLINGVYELKLLEDVALGNIFIIDCTHLTLGHLTKLTPTLIKKCNTLTEKVYNDRQKAAHLIYNGPGADIVLGVLKSVMRAKVRERVSNLNVFKQKKNSRKHCVFCRFSYTKLSRRCMIISPRISYRKIMVVIQNRWRS